tara:strand:+ start:306 stop:5930 length:5625 start_codon:yes stop_codon:yes gene_type:complete
MVKINPINPNSLALQTFDLVDFEVIPNTVIDSYFNPVNDRIEYFIYDFNNNLLDSNTQLTSFTPIRLDGEGNIIEISLNPEKDALGAGFDSGIIKTLYNFITPELGSDPNNLFYISEISPSRTEVRLSSNNISNFQFPDDLPEFQSVTEIDNFRTETSLFFTEFKEKLFNDDRYFDEFYLNLGDNLYLLGINLLLEIDLDTKSISLLIKLYEPLPTNIGQKSELYIITKTGESVGYQIDYPANIEVEDTSIKLSPANYNIPIKDQTGPLTTYRTYSDITSTTLSGSLSELMADISSSSATLTVDYTDYEDFVFFSSANERLINFKQKLTQISSSQAELNLLYSTITGPSSGSPIVSSSKNILTQNIQTTITSFDGYESYLYYNSGSKSWPKSNSVIPYILVPPTDAAAVTWFDDQSITASSYDNQNQNNLEFVVPEFIRSNSSNTNYLLFTNMIGQFFDEIWLYTKEITSKLDANSNIYEGVSKDLVGTVLESLGTKIYDSSFTLENIYSSLIGLSSTGATSPSTGSEYITNYVTSSIDTDQVPTIDDFVKLSYKKIYHNLPYLLKKKGTNAGLRALINLFGVPDTILRISEFGGKDKNEANDWDRWDHQFNYKLDITTPASQYVETPWILNSEWQESNPLSIQLRFQTPGLQSGIDNVSQSLWSLDNGTDTALVLEYTGSGYTSGSYSGSIPDVENQFATLKFIPDFATAPTVSASVYLPFYDGGWWSVMVNRNGTDYTLYAANNIYEGNDGSSIGFIESSSASGAGFNSWTSATTSYFGTNNGSDINIGSNNYKNFTGSYQEIRYYNTEINDGVFRDYTMNPNSIEGNTLNSGPNELAFRAPLGGQLYTSSISMHPKVTGSWIATSSFTSNSNFQIFGSPTFNINRDYIFYDQIPAGVKNIVSNKIKLLSNDLPYTGSLSNTPTNKVLSSKITVQQKVEPSSSYIDDINYLEVAFSPQNEINENINSSIGYFNIGEYIGDPRLVSSSAESYPALDGLRNDYFEKYTHSYDIWDYIRLIRYYDNALFKMIKDYVPARTSLATGIVIKQHILERNKYPVPQLDTLTTTSFQHLNDPFAFENIEVSGSPIQMYTITGSNGGVMPELNGEISASGAGFNISPITQSWSGINDTIQGPVSYTSSTQHEFFDGEFSGSEFIATNGEMNPECDPFKSVSTIEIQYSASFYSNNAGSGWKQVRYYNGGSGQIKYWFVNTARYVSSFIYQDYDFQITQITINEETGNDLNLSSFIPNITQLVIPGEWTSSNFTGDFSTGWTSNGGALPLVTGKFFTGGKDIILTITNVQVQQAVDGTRYYLLEVNSKQTLTIRTGLLALTPTATGSVIVNSGSLWDESLVVMEPFVPQNFFNSDCNPIINNTLNDRQDPFFLDVDYSSNAIVAVNTQAILSGSATPARVQASNYTLARQIRPRYLGSRNEGLYLNKWTPSGSLYNDGLNIGEVWGGDESFGKTAVIDQYGSYGLFYNGGGTGDLLNGGYEKTIFLKTQFMFDSQGNTLQPKINSPYYWNGISSFVRDSPIQITVYNSASISSRTLSSLQSEENKVKEPFTYFNTYLTTASGSIYDNTGTDAFEYSGSLLVCDDLQCVTLSPTAPGQFNASQALTISVTKTASSVGTTSPLPTTSNGTGTGATVIVTSSNGIDITGVTISNVGTGGTYASGDTITVSKANMDIDGSMGTVGGDLTMNIFASDLVYGSWFEIDASTPNILETNTSLSTKMLSTSGGKYYQINPGTPSAARIGYDDQINFILPTVGSYILFSEFSGGFQNTINNRYTITQVQIVEVGSSDKVFITLDKPVVQTTSNLNQFMFYDALPDASKLYTNIALSGSAVGSGFIFTENTSDNFKNALDSNISDFDVKGII